MTRVVTLIAIATLAAAVLFGSIADYRMSICIIVSVAAVTLVVCSLSKGKILCAVLFLAALAVFTPFRNSPFSHEVVVILNLATMALFAVSPVMLRKSITPVISSAPQGRQ